MELLIVAGPLVGLLVASLAWGADSRPVLRSKEWEQATLGLDWRERLDSTAAEYAASPEHSFEFGLCALLDGLEAQLVDGRAAADQNGPQQRRRDQ